MTSTNYHGHHNQVPWPADGAKIGKRLKIYGTFPGQEGRFSCTAIQDLAGARPAPGPWKLILGFGARQEISLHLRPAVGQGSSVGLARWHKRLPVTKVDGRISAVRFVASCPLSRSWQPFELPFIFASTTCQLQASTNCAFFSFQGSRSAQLTSPRGNCRELQASL